MASTLSPSSILRFKFPLIITIAWLLNSCDVNNSDLSVPGTPMLSLEWEIAKPDYVNTGTSAIPPIFEYGRFYPANPGWFTLYYEGIFYNNGHYENYAYELEYQIWQNPAPGNYQGAVGPNSYLSLICSPFGPFTMRNNKSHEINGFTILENINGKITIEKEIGLYILRVTYRKKI